MPPRVLLLLILSPALPLSVMACRETSPPTATMPAALPVATSPSSGAAAVIAPSAPPAPSAPATPALGQRCTSANPWTCLGETTVGACLDGVWTQSRCRGPNGCRPREEGDADCDESVAEEGETCLVLTDVVCGPDKKRMLRCFGHAWRLGQRCDGDLGCVLAEKVVRCDNSIAAVMDACLEQDDYACTHDHKSALRCSGDHFSVASHCKGPKGCIIDRREVASTVKCDDSVADVGDPCEGEGRYACSMDLKRIVVCRTHRFEADDRCKSREKCAIRGESVGCY